MPTLNANLVSISAFDRAGLTTTFGNGKGVIHKPDGTLVLAGKLDNGMYVLDTIDNTPNTPIAMTSLSNPASLEQWHRHLTRCSPLMIQDMVAKNLVDGLMISQTDLNSKCEDCILGHQTCWPFDGKTEKDLAPMELVSFDLWGPSHTQSTGGKTYLMIIVDARTSYKYGAYLSDKLDSTTLVVFEIFRAQAETMTGKKVHQLRMDRAFESLAWEDYCQKHGITHEFTTPYSSAQNRLAEHAIWTTIYDIHTLLWDSNLSHSYWAEAAAYSIYTQNLIPSRWHPNRIRLEPSVGPRILQLLEPQSLIQGASNANYLGMHQEAVIIRYRMLRPARSSFLKMWSLRKVSLTVHQLLWISSYIELCLFLLQTIFNFDSFRRQLIVQPLMSHYRTIYRKWLGMTHGTATNESW